MFNLLIYYALGILKEIMEIGYLDNGIVGCNNYWLFKNRLYNKKIKINCRVIY